MTRSRTTITAYAGILAGILATGFIFAPWHGATLVGTLLLATVPAGAGVMCWVDSGEDAAQAGLTLVVSLAIFAIGSAIMIWVSAWHPRALLALAGAGVLSCLVRLVQELRR